MFHLKYQLILKQIFLTGYIRIICIHLINKKNVLGIH